MIRSRNCIPQPSAFIRREALDAVGLLDESLHYTMDLDLFLRIARHREPRFIGDVLSVATYHDDAKTVRDRDAMARERQVVRRRYARPWELPIVALQPVVSRLYHAMPTPGRAAIDRLRPRRTFDEPRG
jgi:GT2 family glycosyltransferase